MKKGTYVIGALFAVGIVLFPFVISSAYVTGVMCFIAIYGVLALGMAVLLEYAGVLSLAHPAWFMIGAYATAMAATRGVPPVLAMLVAALLVGLISYVIGAPLLRLKGFYLICATFCLIIILGIAIINGGSLTGGHDGIPGIPALSVGPFVLGGDRTFYLLSWGLCLGSLWFFHNLMYARVGRAIRSFNDSEAASTSMGINIPKYKLRIFVITAIMASLAGSILCFWLKYITVEIGGFPMMVELITIIVIGGGKRLYGPILGSLVVTWLREAINIYLGKILPVMKAEVDTLFFGLIIVLMLIYMPSGLAGWVDQAIRAGRRVSGRSKEPYSSQG